MLHYVQVMKAIKCVYVIGFDSMRNNPTVCNAKKMKMKEIMSRVCVYVCPSPLRTLSYDDR